MSITYNRVGFTLDLDLIAEALTLHAVTHGLTLAQMAKGAGISRMTLWRLTRGQKLSLTTLHAITAYLGVDPTSVLKATTT